MNRPLRAASGLAVFLMTVFLVVMIDSTFIFQSGVLTTRNFIVLGTSCAVITILSFVAAYLLISDAVKSK
jgi:hypothetical protein